MKKLTAILLGLIVVVFCFGACGKESFVVEDAENPSYGYTEKDSIAEQTESNVNEDLEQRKLIKTVSLNAETEAFNAFVDSVQKAVNTFKGYVEASDISSENKYNSYRYADFTLRIPTDNLDKFVAEVSNLATITNSTTNTEDVTLKYVDLEAHLKILRSEQKNLTAMLEKAQSLSDIITIRDRLTKLSYEIESYQSSLNKLENLVSYSTVNISVSEVKRETETSGKGVWARIGSNLKNNVAAIGSFFEELFIFVVSVSPFLAVFAVFLFLVLFFAVFLPKKIKKRQTKKEKENS